MKASEPVPSDARERTRVRTELDASFAIEAGAGTGKTTLLVDRLMSLVTTGRAKLTEVAVITFTELAAGGLKEKIRCRIQEQLPSEPGDESRDRLHAALHDLERAQVSTIHAFAAQLLRAHPIEADVDPQFKIVDESEASLLIGEVWDRWLAAEMAQDAPPLREAIAVGVAPGQVERLRDVLLEHRELRGGRPSARSHDRPAFLRALGKSMPAVEQLQESCSRDDDGMLREILSLRAFVDELQGADEEAYRGALLARRKGSYKRKGRKTSWKPQADLGKARDTLQVLDDRIEKARAEIAHNLIAGLSEWLFGFVDAYEEEKRRRGVLDFQDLLLRARDLLVRRPDCRAELRRVFRRILVDEFQDTNPLQVEIVFLLAEANASGKGSRKADWRTAPPEPGALDVIGDPKQSIYRFRHADIEMYEDAKQHLLLAGKRAAITENFRCVPSIVDWVNAVFKDCISKPEDGDYQPDYEPIRAFRAKGGPAVPPDAGVALLCPQDSGVLEKNLGERRRHEADCVADFLEDVVEKRSWSVAPADGGGCRAIRYGDMAVLFRTDGAIDAYEDAFRARGIPYRLVGGKRYYARYEVRALAALLRAIENPHDTVSIVAAMRSSFLGVSDEEIFLHVARGGILDPLAVEGAAEFPPAVCEALRLIGDLHRQRNETSVPLFLHTIFRRTKAFEVFLLKPHGDQMIANLRKVAEEAYSLRDAGVGSLGRFARWLSESEKGEIDAPEAPLAEPGTDAVTLMTIHKAKGLEFGAVVLADLCPRIPRGPERVVDRKEGRLHLRLGNREQRLASADFAWAEALEAKRGAAEEIRLFYVACTRARDHLLLPIFNRPSDGRPSDGADRGSVEYLDLMRAWIPAEPSRYFGKIYEAAGTAVRIFGGAGRRRWPPPLRFSEQRILDGVESVESKRRLAGRGRWLGHRSEVVRRASVGRPIRSATEIRGAVGAEGRAPTPGASSGRGADFGNLVHRILADAALPGLADLEPLAEAHARALGFGGGERDRAVSMIRRAVRSRLGHRLEGASQVRREMPFILRSDGVLIEGAIDLVIEKGEAIVIVDYKTDKIGASEAEAHAGNYRMQAAVYALALSEILDRQVSEVVLYFLHPDEEVVFPVDRALLADAGSAVRQEDREG